MDRKSIFVIFLSFAIVYGWQKLYLEPRTQPAPSVEQIAAPTSQTQVAPAPSVTLTQKSSTLSASQSLAVLTPKTRTLTTRLGDVVINDGFQMFGSWQLKSYRSGLTAAASIIDLNTVTNQLGEFEFIFDDNAYTYLKTVRGQFSDLPAGGLAWSFEDDNLRLTREIYASSDKDYLDVKLGAQFKKKRANYAFISIASAGTKDDPEEQDRQLVYFSNSSIERLQVSQSLELKEMPTAVKYVGATTRYFLFSVISQGPIEPRGLVQPLGPSGGKISLVYPITENSITLPVRVFFGPKAIDVLRGVEPKLDHAVDFGWFTIFAYPILSLLKWLYSLVGNYGLAIILLTVFINILVYPLNYKSTKSMKDMARLQPQLQRIKEKYKDDKEALNREMLTMMKSHGYNPMAGCLPILLQLPIFFALYRVLYSSIELYHAPFYFWIKDLASKDPFYVTPILLTAVMYVQQKMTPMQNPDPAQQKMMQYMPIIFGFMMLSLPSGLTIYMLTNALVGIARQAFLNKKFDIGNVPAISPSR